MSQTPTSWQTYKRLLSYVKPYSKAFIVGILSMILLGLSDSAIPVLIKPLMDGGFVEKDINSLKQTLVLLILLFLARGIFSVTSTGMITWVAGKAVIDIRREMFGKILSLPTTYFDNTTTGSTVSKVTFNVTQVTQAATQTITTLIRDSVTVIGLLAVALYLNWRLTLLIFIIIPLVSYIAKLFASRMRQLSHRNQNTVGEMTHVLEETVKGHKVVKTFNGRTYEQSRFHDVANRLRLGQYKVILAGAANTSVIEMVTAIMISVVIFWGTLQAIELNHTPGHLIAFFAALGLMMSPAKRLASAVQPLQRGLAAAESIFSLLDEEEERDTGNLEAGRLQGEIRFEQVSFAYPGTEKLVLDNINLHIEQGKTVALVGHSGSGKSTIANLIPRFYDPQQGDILIDGHSTASFTLESLRDNIAIVSQDVVLFNDTVKANIAYGMGDQVTNEMIEQAARDAHALEFIDRLANGMDTIIGEDGVSLSGGQKQRLAIARAFLKDAPILILDEATSALDSVSEQQIYLALEQLTKNRTTIMIAHRLSSMRNADTIVVMDQGRIIDSGSHREVHASCPLYRELYNMQQQGSQAGNSES
ncbi:MAG: lipid A export permease/ATP-binding protein MsbA [Chromatiales bacterium]|jgi:subfamily B ATP-binding cassette protein MsbA